jgi:hypothetical protein
MWLRVLSLLLPPLLFLLDIISGFVRASGEFFQVFFSPHYGPHFGWITPTYLGNFPIHLVFWWILGETLLGEFPKATPVEFNSPASRIQFTHSKIKRRKWLYSTVNSVHSNIQILSLFMIIYVYKFGSNSGVAKWMIIKLENGWWVTRTVKDGHSWCYRHSQFQFLVTVLLRILEVVEKVLKTLIVDV